MEGQERVFGYAPCALRFAFGIWRFSTSLGRGRVESVFGVSCVDILAVTISWCGSQCSGFRISGSDDT